MVYARNETEKRNQLIYYLSIDDIAEVLENCTYDTRYILDLQEQEIIFVSEYVMDSEEIQDVFDAVDEDETGRYVCFPIRTDSRDGYTDMELFIDTIQEASIQALAREIISGAGAFKRFKNFIRKYPDLEREWYRWKDERGRLRAAEWLEEEGLILVKKVEDR